MTGAEGGNVAGADSVVSSGTGTGTGGGGGGAIVESKAGAGGCTGAGTACGSGRSVKSSAGMDAGVDVGNGDAAGGGVAEGAAGRQGVDGRSSSLANIASGSSGAAGAAGAACGSPASAGNGLRGDSSPGSSLIGLPRQRAQGSCAPDGKCKRLRRIVAPHSRQAPISAATDAAPMSGRLSPEDQCSPGGSLPSAATPSRDLVAFSDPTLHKEFGGDCRPGAPGALRRFGSCRTDWRAGLLARPRPARQSREHA